MKTPTILFLFFAIACAELGIDISASLDLEGWQCIRSRYPDATWLSLRAWQSGNYPDRATVNNINLAHQVGFTNIDVYIFTCANCTRLKNHPEKVIEGTINNLMPVNDKYNRLWLDVEQDKYWGGGNNPQKRRNQKYFNGLVDAARATGRKFGMYTNAADWVWFFDITNNPFSGPNDWPLWYPNYDNKQNFNSFQPFGGWNAPVIKQYKKDEVVDAKTLRKNPQWRVCRSVRVDLNWSNGPFPN